MAYDFLKLTNDRMQKKCSDTAAIMPECIQDYYMAVKDTVSARTAYLYLLSLKEFVRDLQPQEDEIRDIPDTFFRDVTEEDMTSYRDRMAARGMSVNTIRQRLSSSALFFDHLLRKGLIVTNPARAVDWPSAKNGSGESVDEALRNKIVDGLSGGRRHFWEGTDNAGCAAVKPLKANKRTAYLHELLKSRNVAIVNLFSCEGLQLAELVGLDLEDVDLGRRTIRTAAPDGSIREVDLTDDTFSALRDYLAPTDGTEAYAACFGRDFDEVFGFCLAHKVDTELKKSAAEVFPDREPDFYENMAALTDEIRKLGRAAIGPKKDCRAVFISRRGTRLSPRMIQHMVTTAKKTYGRIDDPDVTPRALREFSLRNAGKEENPGA